MKIDNTNKGNLIASNGVQNTGAFSIARTPHMFNILSSGLYSDKISAVLREIGCNAVDAHIMNGTGERPIEVKLPTALDRSFYIKDFGPGLDDHEVRELYTAYGWSSKQNSDEVTGAFGLGSKSPFAYTLQNRDESDGFTVESTKNGVKRIYTCYLDDSGTPAISRLYEGAAEADWPHGLKVTFPVKGEDIREFHKKSREIFRWFKVMPNIIGLDQEISPVEYTVRGSFFGIELNGMLESSIVMGGVRYPIKTNRLVDLTPVEVALLRSNLIIQAPMGSVMMTPSREELEYTEKTRRGIKALLADVAKELCETVLAEVKKPCDNSWERSKFLCKMFSSMPHSISSSMGLIFQSCDYDSTDVALVSSVIGERSTVLPTWVTANKDGGIGVFFIERVTGRANKVRAVSREVIKGCVESRKAVHLSFSNNVVVFYSDVSESVARVKEAILQSKIDNAILVTGRLSKLPEIKEIAHKLVGMDGVQGLPLKATSSLELPESVVYSRTKRKLNSTDSIERVFSKELVTLMDIHANTSVAELGAISASQKYYMVTSAHSRQYACVFSNTVNGVSLETCGRNLSRTLAGALTLKKHFGETFTGLVIVRSESQARRLRLEEQGFKPLLGEVAQLLQNKDLLKAVQNHQPPLKLDLDCLYSIRNHLGFVGTLIYVCRKVPSFSELFNSAFEGTELLHEMELLTNRIKAHKSPSALDELTVAYSELCDRVSNVGNPNLGAWQDAFRVKSAFSKKYPAYNLISLENLLSCAETQPEAVIQTLKLLSGAKPSLELIPCEPYQLAVLK